MSTEILKLALEALETNNKAWKHLADSGDAGFWEAEEQPFYELSVKAITGIREALAQPERRWVGLHPEEIRKTDHHMVIGAYHYSFRQGAEWAEAKLKEKNT